MLIGSAKQYYFDSLKSYNLNPKVFENAIKGQFQIPESTCALIRDWDTVTLDKGFASNQSKTNSESLEIMIGKFSDIQILLPMENRVENILKNKLLNAVCGVKSCRFEYHKPADTIQGAFKNLHLFVSTAKKDILKLTESSAPLLDCRYVRNYRAIKPRHPTVTITVLFESALDDGQQIIRPVSA